LLYWFETVITVKKIPLIIARFGQAFKDMGGFQTTFPFAPALPSGSEWNQAEQAWREIVDV